MKLILILCLNLLIWANTAQGGSNLLENKKLYFNLGSHTEFYNAVQNDDSGGLRKFDFAPTIGVGLLWPTQSQFSFLPEFNWVLPQTMENSHIMINTFMLRADAGYDLMSWLRLRLGTSLMWQNQQGKGGTAQMNNGNTTSNFYYPDENRSSLNNTLDFGFETVFDPFALRLQVYTYSVFKKEQRQFSYTFFASYYWDK
jgi:hypothetical protein